jgi:hypothetical protein
MSDLVVAVANSPSPSLDPVEKALRPFGGRAYVRQRRGRGHSGCGPRRRCVGALLVKTARGPIIDEKALIEALDSGRLGGAALDVVETEPPPKDSPLIGRPNVVLRPHTAFYSAEALEELQTKCATD